MVRVEMSGATVVRGGRRLLEAVDLVAEPAERVVLLGPSGAGKTTLLRAIAGLAPLASGRILFDDVDVTDAPARDRQVAFLDQQGSLQPHLDVRANLEFALRLHHVPPPEIERRVEAEARAFSIQRLLPRWPRTLAAGERHEVALARSVVRQGRLLLLDEPFARVDAHRQGAISKELIGLQEGYGLTTLLATNDQRTALAAAHRIAVLHQGRLAQFDTPAAVHDRPASEFVAGFLGSPAMNLLPAVVVRHGRGAQLRGDGWSLRTDAAGAVALVGRNVTVGFRPEALRPTAREGWRTIAGRVHHVEFLGADVAVTVVCSATVQVVTRLERPGPDVADPVMLAVDRGAIHLFEPDGPALAHDV